MEGHIVPENGVAVQRYVGMQDNVITNGTVIAYYYTRVKNRIIPNANIVSNADKGRQRNPLTQRHVFTQNHGGIDSRFGPGFRVKVGHQTGKSQHRIGGNHLGHVDFLLTVNQHGRRFGHLQLLDQFFFGQKRDVPFPSVVKGTNIDDFNQGIPFNLTPDLYRNVSQVHGFTFH